MPTGPIDTDRLDALLASIDEHSMPPPSRPLGPPPERGPRRGFLDLCAVVMAVYTLVVATPVGQLIERGYNTVLGRNAKTRTLISYFEMASGSASGTDIAQLEEMISRPRRSEATTLQAKKIGLDPQVARAVVLMASGGKKSGDHYDVVLLDSGRPSFAAVGVNFPAADATAKVRQEALVEVVAKLSKRLGGTEPAVAATAIQLTHVAYAVDRAKASGAERPTSYGSFRNFLPADLRRNSDPLVRGTFALVTAFDMRWPVPHRTRVSSAFGPREHPVLGTQKMHTGTDLAVPTGTEIRAVADGVVQYATEDSVNGKFVKLDHGNGLSSAYCHASELRVKRGASVQKGDVIMLSGSSGRVSGPHLHFQLELDRKPLNPELFKKRRPPVAKK